MFEDNVVPIEIQSNPFINKSSRKKDYFNEYKQRRELLSRLLRTRDAIEGRLQGSGEGSGTVSATSIMLPAFSASTAGGLPGDDDGGNIPPPAVGFAQDTGDYYVRVADGGGAWEPINTNGIIHAANYASLPAPVEIGTLGVTDNNGYIYIYKQDIWRIHNHFEQASAPDASVGVYLGDEWYDTDHDYTYYFNGTTFRIKGMFRQATAPSGQFEQIGDHWLDTDDGRVRFLNGSSWVLIPYINPSANKQGGDLVIGSDKGSLHVNASDVKLVTHIN